MMELGNICFGNSRGNYHIPRQAGWEFHLERLMYAMGEEPSSYGVNFENDAFVMMPYWWGDCTCGFDNFQCEEEHRENCYQSEVDAEKIKQGWRQESKYWLERPTHMSYDEANDIERDIRIQMCHKHGIPWDEGRGCAVHCDCDLSERYEQWAKKVGYPEGCKDDCKLVVPNFKHKATGFEISWYKYFLRDSYMSDDITLEQFAKIVDACIESLEQED